MKTFGELSREEKLALFEAWLDGKAIQYYLHSRWNDLDRRVGPSWSFSSNYRVKPSKPSINWDHVAPEWKYMATDRDGLSFLFKSKPKITGSCDWDDDHPCIITDFFSSFKPGNCDWEDSLVCRPGYED